MIPAGWKDRSGKGGFSATLVREFPDEDCTKDITVSTDKRAGAYFVLHQRNGADHRSIGVDVEAVIEALRLAGHLPVERPSKAEMDRDVLDWNSKYRPGQVVRFWRGLREGPGVLGTTSSEAMVLGGHTAGVYVTGAGFIALTRVEAGS